MKRIPTGDGNDGRKRTRYRSTKRHNETITKAEYASHRLCLFSRKQLEASKCRSSFQSHAATNETRRTIRVIDLIRFPRVAVSLPESGIATTFSDCARWSPERRKEPSVPASQGFRRPLYPTEAPRTGIPRTVFLASGRGLGQKCSPDLNLVRPASFLYLFSPLLPFLHTYVGIFVHPLCTWGTSRDQKPSGTFPLAPGNFVPRTTPRQHWGLRTAMLCSRTFNT